MVIFGRARGTVTGRGHREGFGRRTGHVLFLDLGDNYMCVYLTINLSYTFLFFVLFCIYLTIKACKSLHTWMPCDKCVEGSQSLGEDCHSLPQPSSWVVRVAGTLVVLGQRVWDVFWR